jgi:hypothetical protein
MRFWNNLHQVRSQSRNVGKPNNLNVLGSKTKTKTKNKGPKQYSQKSFMGTYA